MPMVVMKILCRAVFRNFARGGGGGGKFGVRTKEGGGQNLYEVLHPILARGGGGARMT